MISYSYTCFCAITEKRHLFITTTPLVWILYSAVRERIIYFFVNSRWKLVEANSYHSLKYDLFRHLYKNQSKKVLYKLQEYRKRKFLMDPWLRMSYEYKVIRYVIGFCACNVLTAFIFGALRDLVPFLQFKKREKHPWRSVNFSKVSDFSLQLY